MGCRPYLSTFPAGSTIATAVSYYCPQTYNLFVKVDLYRYAVNNPASTAVVASNFGECNSATQCTTGVNYTHTGGQYCYVTVAEGRVNGVVQDTRTGNTVCAVQ